jgi:hypothetical protein
LTREPQAFEQRAAEIGVTATVWYFRLDRGPRRQFKSRYLTMITI